MAELNISNSTTTSMNSSVADYTVAAQTLDSPSPMQKETFYDFPNASKQLGYFKTIPELKSAITALAIWSVGKGYSADNKTNSVLSGMIGWGEDSFQSICENLLIQKKIFGDAFAEVVRDEETGDLINLKPLFAGDMRVVVDGTGMILRYEQRTFNEDGKNKIFQPTEILHLCNDRIANEIHGISVIDSVKWVIDAKNEAMSDERKIKHRELALGILYIDSNDVTKRNEMMRAYENAIKNGEVLVLPKDTAELKDSGVKPQDRIAWINYLDNYYYQVVQVPKVIATSQDYSEAGSKVGYLTFEPIYTREQTLIESDLFNQIGITVKFNRPVSLGNMMQESEAKNTGQTAIQPNEMMATMTRSE